MKNRAILILLFITVHINAQENEQIIKIIKEPAKNSSSLNSISDGSTNTADKKAKRGGLQLVQDTEQTEETEEGPQTQQQVETVQEPQTNRSTPDTAQQQTRQTQPVPEQRTAPAPQVQVPTPMSGDSVLLESGISLYNSGSYQAAVETLRELRENFAASPLADQANMWIAKSYFQMGRTSDGLAALELIPESSGEYPASLYLAGTSYLSLKENDTAKQYFYRATSLFPSHEIADDALLELCKLYYTEGNGEEALKSAVYILKNYSDRDSADDAFYMMGKIYEKDPRLKDIERARKIFTLFITRAENKEVPYHGSPLLHKVKNDLAFINKNYFASE